MIVDELREILERYDAEKLKKTLVEVYKKIPKKIKEEKSIDDIILGAGNISRKKSAKNVDPEKTILEVRNFIELAREGLYFRPNRIVNKSERSKWRTTARNLIKSLSEISNSRDNYNEANDCYIELFKLFCDAEEVYIFVSTTPFSALKVSKIDMFREILFRLFDGGYNETIIKKALDLLLYVDDEYNFYRSSFINLFLFCFKIPDTIDLLISELKMRKGELIIYLKARLYYKMGDPIKALNTIKTNINKKDNAYYNMIFSVIAFNEDVDAWKKEYAKYKGNNTHIDMVNAGLEETGEFGGDVYFIY